MYEAVAFVFMYMTSSRVDADGIGATEEIIDLVFSKLNARLELVIASIPIGNADGAVVHRWFICGNIAHNVRS